MPSVGFGSGVLGGTFSGEVGVAAAGGAVSPFCVSAPHAPNTSATMTKQNISPMLLTPYLLDQNLPDVLSNLLHNRQPFGAPCIESIQQTKDPWKLEFSHLIQCIVSGLGERSAYQVHLAFVQLGKGLPECGSAAVHFDRPGDVTFGEFRGPAYFDDRPPRLSRKPPRYLARIAP